MANKKLKTVSVTNNAKQSNKKSFIIKLSAIILAVIFFILCVCFVIDSYAPANPKDYHRWVLSGINGSYNKEGNPKTYWQVEKTKVGEKGVTVYAKIRVSSWSDVDAIWLNVSDLYEDKTEIEVQSGTSGKTVNEYKLTAIDLKQNQDGWIKIYDLDDANKNTTDSYDKITSNVVFVGFNTKIKVRELVVTKSDGSILTYTVEGIKIDAQEIQVSDSEVKNAENNVEKINDEGKTFSK